MGNTALDRYIGPAIWSCNMVQTKLAHIKSSDSEYMKIHIFELRKKQ